MYELYTTFLMSSAPLKITSGKGGSSELACRKLEDAFERSPLDNIAHMKKLLEEIKLEALETVNGQLARFREVKQLGNVTFHIFVY